MKVMLDSILICQASTMATFFMNQQTDMFLSGRFWVVLTSKFMQIPGEWDMAEIAAFYLVPSIPKYGICPFVLKHWIRFKKNSRLHVLSPPPKKKNNQFFRVTYWHVILEQTNTRYMYDLAIDFIMCNTARFWICSCLYGNNSDVAFD